MRNEGLCTESIRAIQQYFALLPFDAHQSGLQPNFSGLCTSTNQSQLAVFCIDRNAIGYYDFVRIGGGTLHSRPANLWTKPTNVLWQQPCARARFLFFHRWMEVGPLKAQKRACALRKPLAQMKRRNGPVMMHPSPSIFIQHSLLSL